MKRIYQEELKTIQLGILDAIVDYCLDNGIQYYLFAGTLIGAVRHKGYIPWDDDLDICMKREDYDAFFRSFNSSGSGRYKAIDYKSCEGYYLASGKVIDTRTILQEEVSSNTAIGAYVDIFPMDYLPSDGVLFKRMDARLNRYRKMLLLKNLKPNKQRSLYKNFLIGVAHIVLKPMSVFRIIDSIDRYARMYEAQSDVCSYIGDISVFTHGEKEKFELIDFRESVKLTFENKEYCVPVGYDRILHKMYGDYMKMPPKEKQISHHSFVAYWKEDN